MKRIIHNKLVRDRIPEIIAEAGKVCHTEIMGAGGYRMMLDFKLDEEVKEYQESYEVEELVDVLEVVYAIAESQGISRAELEALRAEKAEKRGAFKDRIFLIDVVE